MYFGEGTCQEYFDIKDQDEMRQFLERLILASDPYLAEDIENNRFSEDPNGLPQLVCDDKCTRRVLTLSATKDVTTKNGDTKKEHYKSKQPECSLKGVNKTKKKFKDCGKLNAEAYKRAQQSSSDGWLTSVKLRHLLLKLLAPLQTGNSIK